MLIDTHAHLNFRDYQKDLNEVINRAAKNGVKKIICVSSNLADSEKAIELAKQHSGIVYAAIGIHPHNTSPNSDYNTAPYYSEIKKQIRTLEKLAKRPGVMAIGECGLDYSPASPGADWYPAPPGEKDRPREEQLLLFKEQIKLAQKLKLPILVHSRKAFSDVIQILSLHSGRVQFTLSGVEGPTPGVSLRPSLNTSSITGVFHCYSAGKRGIKPVLDLGFYFGFDGNLTYDVGLQNVAKEIPLGKILLETDCPYLSPEPFRGKRNEPKNVKIIAECLAKIKGVSFEKICQTTTQNARKLFKI